MGLSENIYRLLELQALDIRVRSLETENKLLPDKLNSIKISIKQALLKLKQLQEAVKNLEMQQKEQELNLSDKENQVKKYKLQLLSIKTNKEYTAMLEQIQREEMGISVVEENILGLMDQVSEQQAIVQKEKDKLSEKEKQYREEEAKTKERMAQIDEKLAEFSKGRVDMVKDIDKELLSIYEKVAHKKQGRVIVPVEKDGVCGGCHMALPPQVQNEVMKIKDVITCEHCGCILYKEDK